MNIIFTSGSEVFLKQLESKIILVHPEIKGSVSYGSGAYRLRYNWRNALIVAEYIYQDIVNAPYLKYKFDKYSNFLNRNTVST